MADGVGHLLAAAPQQLAAAPKNGFAPAEQAAWHARPW